jgi:glycine cleavage system aminomethyltransferase T/glycine/D-amino acid oxidase-like deaminating enzyme
LTEKAQVVIVGGGVIGLSIAYHLGHLGIQDVVLLERNQLSSGTSWHAAGIVGPLRASMNLTALARYAIDLFGELEAETDQATGYRQTGGLWLTQTRDRLQELKRIGAMGDMNALDTEIISAHEVRNRFDLLHSDDLAGGLWVEQDGQVNPVDLCMAYAKGARAQGVQIRENCTVTAVESQDGAVKAVKLADGSHIECEKLVNCAGAWARQFGELAGIKIPLVACEHMYLVSEPIAKLPDPCPIVRDLDAGIYLKEDSGKLVLGTFEPNPRLWQPGRDDAAYLMFDEDWEHVGPMVEAGLHRLPVLGDYGTTHFMNGPESFTPDTRQIMGESPDLKNYFVAAGFNSIGVMSSAGVGKVMADWIRDNQAPLDLWEVDILRLDPLMCNDDYLASRLPESVHNQFAPHWPYKQFKTGRNLRKSIWHNQLASQGAVFGAPTGWERPLWYARDNTETSLEYSYGRQNWWPAAKNEALHCAANVSLFELSPFAKFQLEGVDALALLQYLCCSDIDVAVGRTVYTLMLNSKGGIEAELTVTRLSQTVFWVVSGAATRFKDLYWMRKHRQEFERVDISDKTESYAVLGVMGPQSRALMQSLCDNDMSDAKFAFSSTQTIGIVGVELRATRLSFVGELGWELTIPVEHAIRVYGAIVAGGKNYRLGHAGHFCLDSCRLEKGYRHWGHDMGSEDTPWEMGLGFAVELNKGDEFIGRQSLLEQDREKPSKHLLLCEVEAEGLLILHDEPVYQDNALVGRCSSGGQGFRTGKLLCFVIIKTLERQSRKQFVGSRFDIEVAGERFPIKVLARPPYQVHLR